MEICTDLNPRLVQGGRQQSRGDAPAVVQAVCDCPCGDCGRTMALERQPGVFEPPTEQVELTQEQWRELLANYSVEGVVHRFIPGGDRPCAWMGTIRNGVIRDHKGRNTRGKFGRKIEEVQAELAKRERGEPAGVVKGR